VSVIITGITGFVGSKLAQTLVEQGTDVYGLVRHVSRSDLRSLEPILEKIHFVEGDLAEYHSVRSAIASVAPEAVLHLGALTPVRHSFEDPFPYAKINYEGTMNVAHAVLEASPRTRVIAASTAEVYGWQPQVPTREDARMNPSSPYAVSKAAADTYLQMAIKVYGLRATILRCNNTYGRIGESGFLVEYVVSSMIANRTVYIGAPDHIRDYMIVDDHVDAYLRALRSGEATGEVFNVSPGNPVSNIDLAKKVAELVSFKGRIAASSYPPGYPVRPSQWDTDYIVLDSQKIRAKLGWKPSVTLDEGLRRVVDLWRHA
jgi:nucleoside-diphosphate-sugar epimerase